MATSHLPFALMALLQTLNVVVLIAVLCILGGGW